MNDNIALHTLLGDIYTPANYRWVLEHADNVLALRVQRRDTYTFFGRQFKLSWTTIREMTAPTYGAMLRQLQEWPEFLEFYRASDQPLRRATVVP